MFDNNILNIQGLRNIDNNWITLILLFSASFFFGLFIFNSEILWLVPAMWCFFLLCVWDVPPFCDWHKVQRKGISYSYLDLEEIKKEREAEVKKEKEGEVVDIWFTTEDRKIIKQMAQDVEFIKEQLGDKHKKVRRKKGKRR